MGYPPPPWSCGITGLQAKTPKIFELKGLIWKIFRNKDLARFFASFSGSEGRGLTPANRQILRFAQDFGSGLPLRSRPLNASSCQRALKITLYAFAAHL